MSNYTKNKLISCNKTTQIWNLKLFENKILQIWWIRCYTLKVKMIISKPYCNAPSNDAKKQIASGIRISNLNHDCHVT